MLRAQRRRQCAVCFDYGVGHPARVEDILAAQRCIRLLRLKLRELVKQVNSSINMYFMSLRNTLIYGWNNARNKVLRVNGFLYIDVVMVLMHK